MILVNIEMNIKIGFVIHNIEIILDNMNTKWGIYWLSWYSDQQIMHMILYNDVTITNINHMNMINTLYIMIVWNIRQYIYEW